MPAKLVIFDFDGTLADSFAWFARVLNGIADKYRFRRVEAHEVESLRGLSARELVGHLGVPFWKLPLIAAHARKLKASEPTRLFDGVDRMLRDLNAHAIAIAVVSSDAESNVRAALGSELARLVTYFDCGASLYGKAKKFRKVLSRSGCHASAAICIGDELRDLEAARQAGIAFGAVAWGYTRPEALQAHAPDEMFNSMHQICARLCHAKDAP
jgi:phosphoglycolate phosphatase